MRIEIEIPYEEIIEEVKNILARKLCNDYTSDRVMFKREIAQATRDIVYKDKQEIADRVVAQATAEVRRTALKKMLDKLGGEAE